MPSLTDLVSDFRSRRLGRYPWAHLIPLLHKFAERIDRLEELSKTEAEPGRWVAGEKTSEQSTLADNAEVFEVAWGDSLSEAVAAACVRAQHTGKHQKVEGNGQVFIADPSERVSRGLERWTSQMYGIRTPKGWLEKVPQDAD